MGSGGSLLSFIVRRLLITIPLLLLISFAVFSLVLILPGNPALALAGGVHSSPAKVAEITRQLHLNEPFWRQYLRWLNGVIHGDLGNSLFNKGQTVASGIATRFPVTLSLAVGGMILSILIGVPAGIIAGVRNGSAHATGWSPWAPASAWPSRTSGWPCCSSSCSPSTPIVLPALGYVEWSTSPWSGSNI